MIYLIAGPPCAGKTTLATRLAKPGDPVLDFDDICAELDHRRGWEHTTRVKQRASDVMHRRLLQLRQHDGNAYVIRCAPEPHIRANLAALLNATVWVLNPGMTECQRRAAADGRAPRTIDTIRDWYRRYRPATVDQPPPSLDTQAAS